MRTYRVRSKSNPRRSYVVKQNREVWTCRASDGRPCLGFVYFYRYNPQSAKRSCRHILAATQWAKRNLSSNVDFPSPRS